MLLSRKEIVKNDKKNYEILKHMSYSAAKLWNVGNYEKRNYKALGMKNFPDWYDQKKRLKDNFFYKNLPSQSAQDVLQQLQEAWKSYFRLLETKGVQNPRPPRFKRDEMPVTFLRNAIRQTGPVTRLTIPKQLKIFLADNGTDADYIYLKTKKFSNIRIKELQARCKKNGILELIAVYETDPVPLKKDNNRYLSIDIGVNNTFTCYDSTGKTFIVNGYLNATHYCDKKIAYYQSINSSQQTAEGVKYPKPSKRVMRLYVKKNNKVNDFLHKATHFIAEYSKKNDICTVVIGDIKNIRKNANIGRNNQQLHALPYKKIYSLLEYKLQRIGVRLIKQKENYSSQCPPDSKKVAKEYAHKTNRKHRGLYVYNKKIYNADCVGAYNIMRLYLEKINKSFPTAKGLSNPVKVSV